MAAGKSTANFEFFGIFLLRRFRPISRFYSEQRQSISGDAATLSARKKPEAVPMGTISGRFPFIPRLRLNPAQAPAAHKDCADG